jgi:hypothetical protein
MMKGNYIRLKIIKTQVSKIPQVELFPFSMFPIPPNFFPKISSVEG